MHSLAIVGVILILERSASWYTWNAGQAGENHFSAVSNLLPWRATKITNAAIGSSVTKSIIVASVKKEDTAWIDNNFPDWEINTYVTDSKEANYTVFRNQGREANVYLTYIINHYYTLPDYMVFIHAQRYQWHNDDPMYDGVGPLKNLQLGAVDREGYVSLRATQHPGCPVGVRPKTEGEDDLFSFDHKYADVWRDFFPDQKVPNLVSAPCCAQFAVSRAAVHARPLAAYEQYRDFLWHNDVGSGGKTGRIFEYLWHVIFGKPSIYCPSAPQSYCHNFGLCDLKCPQAPQTCLGRFYFFELLAMKGLHRKWPKLGQGEGGLPSDKWWEEWYPPSEYDGWTLRSNVTRSKTSATGTSKAITGTLRSTTTKKTTSSTETTKAETKVLSGAEPEAPPAAPTSKLGIADDKPIGDKLVGDKPASDKPVAEKPGAGKPTSDMPGSNEPIGAKPIGDKPQHAPPAPKKPLAKGPAPAGATLKVPPPDMAITALPP